MRYSSLIGNLAGAGLALWLVACGGGGGGSSAPPPAPTDPTILQDTTAYGFAANDALPAGTAEREVATPQSIQLDGAAFAYTATVGHLNAGTPTPRARMFYVAYTRPAGATPRPIVFFYNGGPGSATVWLHLGSFGPRRIVTNNPNTNIPSPYQMVDNQQTLLADADLVFVDAIGTGYSEALAPANNRSHWGVEQDAAVFRDFVLRYTEKNQRQGAPLVLFGESYGGLRTPLVAQALLAAGAPLRAIVLQSAILNYNSNCAVLEPGRLSCGHFIPSYGATAAWFQRAQPQPALPTGLDSYVSGVLGYVEGSYEAAAELWLRQALPLSAAVTQQLAAYTGVSSAAWQAAPLMQPDTYRRGLLANTLLGRYDSRVNAPVGSALASEGDPSDTLISPAFRGAIGDYLRTLKYQPTTSYSIFNNAAINLWDWRHDGNALPDAIPDLALALALRPSLEIMVIGGYHDLATPFRLTELDLARLGAAPAGLQLKRYVGGHMTYLDDTVRPGLAADVAAVLRAL